MPNILNATKAKTKTKNATSELRKKKIALNNSLSKAEKKEWRLIENAIFNSALNGRTTAKLLGISVASIEKLNTMGLIDPKAHTPEQDINCIEKTYCDCMINFLHWFFQNPLAENMAKHVEALRPFLDYSEDSAEECLNYLTQPGDEFPCETRLSAIFEEIESFNIFSTKNDGVIEDRSFIEDPKRRKWHDALRGHLTDLKALVTQIKTASKSYYVGQNKSDVNFVYTSWKKSPHEHNWFSADALEISNLNWLSSTAGQKWSSELNHLIETAAKNGQCETKLYIEGDGNYGWTFAQGKMEDDETQTPSPQHFVKFIKQIGYRVGVKEMDDDPYGEHEITIRW